MDEAEIKINELELNETRHGGKRADKVIAYKG